MPQENNFNLSIIIPSFNEDKYLKKLFSQLIKYFNYKNIEIILIDDGSKDQSDKIINDFKKNNNFIFHFKTIKHDKNYGKGRAIQTGIKHCNGEYILLQDADLELDLIDSLELYEMIQNNKDIKCIFGSRYLSGKLKRNNYFLNNLIGKINSLIFNIFFSQSLSDIHCGLKIMHKDIVRKIDLTVNDFGIEIDIASQIVRNNFFIYEVGVSYYFRTKQQGKKITWLDGLKSFYYLFKARFLDNSISTNLSIIFSASYMTYFGFYFSTILENYLSIIIFLTLGLIIGIKFKIITSSIILLSLFIGSLLGSSYEKIFSITIFFIIGIFCAKYVKKNLSGVTFSRFV